MESQNSQTPQKPTKGYGKRPVWQWIAIYAVVAIVVYGIAIIAYRQFHKTTVTNPNGTTTTTSGGLY